jgi:hypothetical protein
MRPGRLGFCSGIIRTVEDDPDLRIGVEARRPLEQFATPRSAPPPGSISPAEHSRVKNVVSVHEPDSRFTASHRERSVGDREVCIGWGDGRPRATWA